MKKTIFEISKMDCPSEENLIRTKLDGIQEIKNLNFDISQRKLTIFHTGNLEEIESSVLELNLGGQRIRTEQIDNLDFEEQANQRKLLWAVLAINLGFFLIEITTGLISKSMGLVADSLDMLADSLVYGISLFAVGGTLARKKQNVLNLLKMGEVLLLSAWRIYLLGVSLLIWIGLPITMKKIMQKRWRKIWMKWPFLAIIAPLKCK